MNICFVTAGPIEWASSRMRAYWVAEAIDDRIRSGQFNARSVDVWQCSKFKEPNFFTSPDIDAFVWQKSVDLDVVQKYPNARHYWDVCDPSWWWQPNECREIAKYMTAVVASSQALADDFNQWYGKDLAVCIPDRLKLSHFHTQRQHRDVSPVRLIWFGIAANRVALWGARANLERLVANGHKIELTIFDDRPDVRFHFSDAFPIYHVQWSLDKEVEVLAAHDVALLPPYPGPWGKVKSNNKHLTSWACGLATTRADSYGDLEMTINDTEYRNWVSKNGVKGGVSIDQSAIEWEALLS